MNLDGIEYVLRNLRERDEQELAEYGIDIPRAVVAFQGAVLAKVFFHDTWPAAVIAFHARTPKSVDVSMLATFEFPRVIRDVLAWCKEARETLLARGFTRAECRCMSGHEDAVRFLDRLGFKAELTIDDYGATGRSFVQFSWRLKDHVSG